MSDLNVDGHELRASGHMADHVNSDDLHEKMTAAVSKTSDAADELTGWSVSQELANVADTWEKALNGLRKRLDAEAAALRGCATNHEWNDVLTGRDFEGITGFNDFV
ncbi:hypothetical protein ACH4VS_00205 [Streptomyces hygroscopicus]|uniref:hypothetical protein n=1 Tax=Streptomyces hygroscopicus TaxID=1912 RepID=UPI000AE35F35|nr:hypothetical protein [Streptomyces hygroscopicus]GLV73243.1 hypothetical protein Shyhy02_12450 [Streptomyces hygroscopicus subsp. hygroscopicus]